MSICEGLPGEASAPQPTHRPTLPARPQARRTAPAISLFGASEAPSGLVQIAIELRWRPIGRIVLDASGKLVFPEAAAMPALYRMRLLLAEGSRNYIGETADLARRFGNYGNPHSGQETSLRIHAALHAHLAEGGAIDVDAVTAEKVPLRIAGRPIPIDLANRTIRRLLEQAAMVADDAADIATLNR
jgi:hypothetical protein